MKRYSQRQIGRALAKHDTVEVNVDIADGGDPLRLLESRDSYALLDRLIEQEEASLQAIRFPYWAEIWPAAIGLARWLTTHSIKPASGWTRELGCGIGLAGVAMARRGWVVEATDFIEDALMFTTLNAQRNGVAHRHRVAYLDWSHPVGESCDCMIASDVAYEKALHPYLNRTLRSLLAPGGRLYLSDPGRPVAQPFIESLKTHGYSHSEDVVVVQWKSLEHRIHVHTLNKPAS
ncbi:MAG: methyltransferase type 12 [Candidatus Latescibacterota bacterium]|nr:methyltransferase type 12 [Candidatus Latescibacterota bacterium]